MNIIKDSKLPTHLITGFLGSGKTTAIQQLLKQKPEHERWAIIVNEFGEVGIDTLAIEHTGSLELLPLSGGCVCCRLGPQLHSSLKILLETHDFDRLLIEPTGMGHPSGILDTLRKPLYRDQLDIRAIICLLDPRQLEDETLLQDATFIDQINMADVVVANKSDLASADQLERFYQKLNNFYPPKQQLLVTQQGYLDLQVLDIIREGHYLPHNPQAHTLQTHSLQTHTLQTHTHHHSFDHQSAHQLLPTPCSPVRYSSEGLGLVSCGWVFHAEDIFDFDALEQLLMAIQGVVRLKGVFRLGAAFVFINRVRDEMDYDAISYRRDSRVEILSETPLDWDAIEVDLIRLTEQGRQSPYRDL